MEPYRLADRTISALNRFAMRRFEQARQRLVLAGFDELNVITTMQAVYAALDSDARRRYTALFLDKYAEVLGALDDPSSGASRHLPHRGKDQGERGVGDAAPYRGNPGAEDSVDELAEAFITGLLEEPDAVTRYAWGAEVLRKKDRAAEAVNAARTRGEKVKELERALRLWSQMAQQYADEVSDGAALAAFRASGVKTVIWFTQDDPKVCGECGALDGQKFPIGKIPPKPHWRCRCWLWPVEDET